MSTRARRIVIGTGAGIAVLVVVVILALGNHPAANPLPATPANRAVCLTVREEGASQAAQAITNGKQGAVSRELWDDLIGVVSASYGGSMGQLGSAEQLVNADCAVVRSG